MSLNSLEATKGNMPYAQIFLLKNSEKTNRQENLFAVIKIDKSAQESLKGRDDVRRRL